MARQPKLPPDFSNPQNTQRLEAGAINNFNNRLNKISRELVGYIRDLNCTVKRVNSAIFDSQAKPIMTVNLQRMIAIGELRANESIYIYELSSFELNRLMLTMEDMINSFLMVDADGNLIDIDAARRLWFMEEYVEVSGQAGANAAFRNLEAQSVVYSENVTGLQQVLFSEPYQRRIAFTASREFNNMKGFTDDIVKEARRVLTQGIMAGSSPRKIASDLKNRIDVNRSRAETIARTEINQAHRSARWAEVDRAAEEYEVRTMILHLASFLPNMRPTHLARTGTLHTTQEQREWYEKNGNAINCRCASVEQVVDSKGKPINDGAIKKIMEAKSKFEGS